MAPLHERRGDEDYSLLDLLQLSAKHGLLESQPKPEDTEILSVLMTLIHRLAEQQLAESEPEH
jgi:hypothetical protein